MRVHQVGRIKFGRLEIGQVTTGSASRKVPGRSGGGQSAWRGFLAACALSFFASGCAAQSDATGGGPVDRTSDPWRSAQTTEIAPPVTMGSSFGSYLAGRHAQRENDWVSAARFLGDVLADRPDDEDLIRRTFILALGAGEIDTAIDLADQVPDDAPEAQVTRVLTLIEAARAGETLKALEAIENWSDLGVNRFLGPLLRGWTLVLADRAGEGRAALEPLERTEGLQPTARLHGGLMAMVAEDDALAASTFDDLAPEAMSLRMALLIARFYRSEGRTDDARALLEEAGLPEDAAEELSACLVCDAIDGMAQALYDVAGALHGEGLGELALVYGRLALHAQPDLAEALLLIGDTLQGKGRYAEAAELYARVPEASYLGWPARLRRAVALEALGEVDEAARQLRQMVDDAPERADVALQLGDLLRREQRFEEAIAAYREGIDRLVAERPEHWAVYYALGIAYERAGRWPEAEAALLQALELNPEQPYVLNYLGYTWADQNVNMERAAEMIERAVAQRPNDGFIVDSLGWVYYRMGRFEEAVWVLERAVALEPDDPTINDHLGDAYWHVGRRAEARFQWRRALNNLEEAEPASGLPERAVLERKLTDGLSTLTAAE